MNNYLVNKCNLKRSKSDHYIFFKKYDKGKLELVMSVHVYDIVMSGKPESINNTKEKIKEKCNIQESEKMKKLLGVYHEWVCDAKGTYTKTTMEKDVKKLVEGY